MLDGIHHGRASMVSADAQQDGLVLTPQNLYVVLQLDLVRWLVLGLLGHLGSSGRWSLESHS